MAKELGRGAQVQLLGMAKAAARGAAATTVEGNSLAKAALDASGTSVALDVAALTVRVTELEAQPGVPGVAGPKGDTGAAGAVGAAGAASTVAGPAGAAGATGGVGAAGAVSIVPGPAGKDGAPGAASTVPGPIGPAGPAGQSITGPAGAAGVAGRDGILSIQRAVLTSGADGTVIWTYPVAYAAGVVPVIAALAEAPAGAAPYTVQIDGVPSNTSVKFRVHKSAQTGAVTSFSAAAAVRLQVLALPPG